MHNHTLSRRKKKQKKKCYTNVKWQQFRLDPNISNVWDPDPYVGNEDPKYYIHILYFYQPLAGSNTKPGMRDLGEDDLNFWKNQTKVAHNTSPPPKSHLYKKYIPLTYYSVFLFKL